MNNLNKSTLIVGILLSSSEKKKTEKIKQDDKSVKLTLSNDRRKNHRQGVEVWRTVLRSRTVPRSTLPGPPQPRTYTSSSSSWRPYLRAEPIYAHTHTRAHTHSSLLIRIEPVDSRRWFSTKYKHQRENISIRNSHRERSSLLTRFIFNRKRKKYIYIHTCICVYVCVRALVDGFV